jgi:serine/threonine-protein kinase
MSDSSPCTRCAAPVSAGARFCSVCGAPVSPSGEVAEDQLLARLRQATLGEYDVLRELGRGGMAAVYLAWDRELARYVAVKVLLPELAHQATMSQRFLQEARTAANLDDHPSVVRVYRAKESQGLRYFVMKYVDGCSLDLLLRAAEPFPVDLAAHVVDQVALALQYAHDHGVVHRDVKPGNVLLDRTGNVVVTDFGIAKIAEADQLTRTGFAIGTPHYMSPEQWRVEPLGPAADQYALGVVAYHMIAGALPFEGTHYEIQEQHLRAEPATLEARRAGVPPELSAIVGLMLGKRPELRFPDLRSVSQALAAMPRDPVPMLRERLARLIPAAGPETGRDATGAGTASDPSLPHSFLRPTPYTPASSLPPVLPASPITPWQPAAAPFGGYTPPGAGGGSAFGPPAAPPGGGTTVPTTPALAGAAAAELTPPEVPSAAPAVAAPAVAAVRSAPTPPSTYAPPAPEARPAPPPPDAAVPDAPPAASPTPGLLGGLGVGLGARLGGTPERPSLSPAPTAPPAPADSTASPLSATESFNALFEPARVDSPAPAERAASTEPATASAAPATPAADAPSGSVAVDEATRATEPPAVFAADGAALAATARPAPRDAGAPDGRRPAAPPFDEPPAATPREEYRADDLPALVSGADVPAPAARRRSPVPMLAAGGALLAVAAGVFATTRGGRTEARAVVPADSSARGPRPRPGRRRSPPTPRAPGRPRRSTSPPTPAIPRRRRRSTPP